MTKDKAAALADRINADPRSDGYDAHGLNGTPGGSDWYVCVNDSQATKKNPSGRALDIHSWREWETALKGR